MQYLLKNVVVQVLEAAKVEEECFEAEAMKILASVFSQQKVESLLDYPMHQKVNMEELQDSFEMLE